MNVLFLTKYNVQKFGIAEVVQSLAGALKPLGVSVLVCSSDPTAQANTLPGGIASVHAPLPRPGLLQSRKPLHDLEKICRDHAIDLVHCHGVYRPGYAARLLKQSMNLPYVLTSWGDIVPTSSRQQRRSVRARCRILLTDADAVTSPSTAIVENIHALLNVGAKHTLIPNGIDLATWRANPAPPVGEHIFALGTLVPQKGFGVLVEAIGRLKASNISAPLLLAGEGTLAKVLREQAAAAETPLTLAGFLGPDAKRNAFRSARLVAFPSQFGEGFPAVLLEAMAAGKAIVASDLPATRAILVDGENAILVPPADADAWADAIERLLTDETLRKQIEQANYATADRYAWPVVAKQFADVYARVLGP